MHIPQFVSERPGRKLTTAGLTVVAFALTATVIAQAEVMVPLHVTQVKAGGEIGRRIDVTIHNNLLALDADKDFLPPFEEKKRTSGYIGLGKLIDAAVRFAAYSRDERVIALKNHLVDKTIATQDPDGYLGMFDSASRMHGMWDVHEVGYLIYGLLSDYEYFGQQRSLDAAKKGADYIVRRWPEIPGDWDARTSIATHVSVTGLERTMFRLNRLTGDKTYRDFCTNQRALADWDLGIVVGRRPLIEGHIYAYLCRCLAQLELYRESPDDRLLRQTHRAIEFMTHQDGMCITGGCGQWEIWTDDQDGRGAMAETCATAYQMRVLAALLGQTGESRYGDLMERTMYNTLFAAQSPDGRHIRYYSPLEGGREYHPGDTYCCPCNYRRIIAELPSMVYYRTDDGVAVNLYTASEADVELASHVSLRIRQQTDYPSSGHVTIQVTPSQPVEFALQLRIPVWCGRARIVAPGKAAEPQEVPGGRFHAIKRTWRSGDEVVLEMPMPWRLVRGRKRQSGRAAVMRGPIVFCLNPAQDEQLADWDGADLGRITLDPNSLRQPVGDNSVRPDGIAYEVRGWKPGHSISTTGDLALRLTEFADPGGKATYFRLRDSSVAVKDELLASE